MLQSFNDRLKGPFTWIIVISISFIFVITGMSFFFTNIGSGSSYVAKVGDNQISPQQFQQYSQGAATEVQKKQVLDQMINQYLIMADSQKHNIVVSKLALQAAIFNNPAFFDENGKFSSTKLQEIANSDYVRGMANLEQMISQNIQTTMIPSNITDTAFITSYEKDEFAKVYSVTKDIEYIKVSPSDFEGKVKVNDTDLKQYYDVNKAKYVNPAKVDVSYFIVSKDDFVSKGVISDNQIKAYYNSHKDLFDKFDKKAKTTITNIIQNRQALEEFNSLTQDIDSIKFGKLESKLGKAKTANITDGLQSTVSGVNNSSFFTSNDKYSSIAVSSGKVLVYQVDNKVDSKQKSFDQVKNDVSKAYIQEQSQELAVKKSQYLLQQLNSDKKVDQKLTKSNISEKSKDFTKEFNGYVLFNSNDEYHEYQGKDGSLYLYKVTKVIPNKDDKNQVPNQVTDAYKQEELNFYLQTIKHDIPVKVNYSNI